MVDPTQLVFALGRVTPSGVNLLGSAFAVGERALATAHHVTGGDDRDLVLIAPRHTALDEYQDTSDLRVQPVSVKIRHTDPFRDVSIIELESAKLIAGMVLGSTDDVTPGDPCVSYGFPHANTGRLVLTQHQSTVGARILIANGPVKSKHLVLNIQTRPGQSGGPVISTKTRSVVAVIVGGYAPGGGGGVIVAGIDPVTLHQTTHAVSAEYVKEMMDD